MWNIRASMLPIGLGLLAVALSGVAGANAQNGPIKILLGVAPGGAIDAAARIAGEKLHVSLGQPVVVESLATASNRIAIQALKASEPNGQTLLVAPAAIVTLFPLIFRDVGYDPLKDLTPISPILSRSFAFGVPANSPAKTFAEFVALAKADPKFARYATPAAGTEQEALGLQLGDLTGVKLENVPLQGTADSDSALSSGSMPSAILTADRLTRLQKAGKARILATFNPARTADLPDVPTFTELGYPALQARDVVAMFGPAGMDPALTARLNKAVRDALADPEVRAKILKLGAEPESSTAQELDTADRAALERWAKVLKASRHVRE
jgi:tripartite-type tricarboxylate transporter receptor subunit TctC